MVTEHEDDPPLLDVSDRPAAMPGPLTKPSPVVRPPRRARWKIGLTVMLLVAAAAAAIAFLPPLFA